DGYYFVTICTSFRKPYLDIASIKGIVAAELALLKQRFSGLAPDYFIVMPNHIHAIFILDNSDSTLSQTIQAFKSITTLKAKQALPLQINGRLWQPNYCCML
ncbi:MAG: transposase, partial [bacterium]